MREIETGLSTTNMVEVDTAIELREWLKQQAVLMQSITDKNCWLLAHCEDGVIWGELRDNGKLALSCEAFSSKHGLDLRWITLQQARLFGKHGELLLWPGPQGWQAILRRDDQGNSVEYIDEEHLLWGEHVRDAKDGFMQIVEGVQGIVHAPPIKIAPTKATNEQARSRLVVRHYLGEDEVGVVRVMGSRLIALLNPGER